MADTTQSLDVRVTATDAASPAFKTAQDAVTGLDAGLKAAAASATSSLGDVDAAATGLGSIFSKLGSTISTTLGGAVTRAGAQLRAEFGDIGEQAKHLGEEIAEGAEMADGALDVLKEQALGVGEAFGTLFGPLAVFLGIGEAIVESVKSASEAQTALTEIGVLVKNAGGNAQEVTKQIDEFGTHLAQSSQFGKDEFVKGIQGMLTAGISLDTAMKSQQAAMDLSVAKNISLEEAEQTLTQAHNGRVRALQQLGLVTKEEVASGLSYDTVLQRIEQRTGGSAAAALQTFSGAMANLKNNVDLVLEGIGNALIPIIEDMAHGISAAAIAIQPFVEKLVDIVETVKGPFEAALTSVVGFSKPVMAAFTQLGGSIQDAWAAGQRAVDAFLTEFGPAIQAVEQWLERVKETFELTFVQSLRVGFEIIALVFDDFTAHVTGKWQDFDRESKEIVGDLLTAIETLFQGRLAYVVATVQTYMDEIVEKVRGAAIALAGLASQQYELAEAGTQEYFNAAGTAAGNMAGHLKDAKAAITAYRDEAAKLHAEDAARAPKKGPEPDFTAPAGPTDDEIAGRDKSKSGSGSEFEAQPLIDQTKAVDAAVAAQTKLDETLQRLRDSEAAMGVSIATATTAQEKYDAEMRQRQTVSADAVTAVGLLTKQIGDQTTEIDRTRIGVGALSDANERNIATYNAAAEAVNHKKKLSEEEKENLKTLKDAVDTTTKAYADQTALLEKLTQQRDANNKRLAEERDRTQALIEFQAAQTLAYNNQREAAERQLTDERATFQQSSEAQAQYYLLQLVELDTYASDYLKRKADLEDKIAQLQEKSRESDIAHQQHVDQLVDEENTYKKSLAQQAVYYQQRLAALVSAGQADSDEAKRYRDALEQLQVDQYKAQIDAQAAFTKEYQDKETSFLDGIIEGHKSLRTSLKSIYDDLVKDFEDWIVQMIEKSVLLAPLQKIITGTLFPGQSGNGGGSSPFGALAAGALGGGGAKGPTGSASDPLNVIAAGATSAFLTPTTGLASGVAAGSTQAALNSAGSLAAGAGGGLLSPITGADGSATWDAAVNGVTSGATDATGKVASSSGGFGSIPGLTGGLAKNVGGALAGFGYGVTLNSLLGGNSTNGTIGAALGSAVGIIGGPLGSAIGGSLGGILGGLIGPHNQNAEGMPDVYNTQQYGSIIADLRGTAGANGTSFTEDSATSSAFGGQTGIAGVEELLAQGQAAFEKATGLGDSDYQTALAQFGASSTGAGTLKQVGTNVGNREIVGATSGGNEEQTYLQLGQTLSAIEAGLTKTGSTAGNPASYTLTRTYPDANVGSLVDANGNVITPASSSSSNYGGVAGANISGSPAAPRVSTQPIAISIGTLVGSDGMNELATILSQAGYENDRGIGVSGSARAGLRRFAGDVTG